MASPNGGKRSVKEAYRMKQEGVRAGASDLFIPEPMGHYHGLWIEMKHDNGRVTKHQREFINAMVERGYMARICNSFDNFVFVVNNYFNMKENGKESQKTSH